MSYQEYERETRFVEREKDFWKRIKLPITFDESSLRGRFWEIMPSKDALEKLIQKEPLTPEGLELVGKFVDVYTLSSNKVHFEGCCTFRDIHEGFPLYSIGINLALCDTDKKQKEALFHEMCHVYYRTGPFGVRNVEEQIQNETLRFLDKNEDYVEKAFARFLPIPGYSFTFKTNQLPLPLTL